MKIHRIVSAVFTITNMRYESSLSPEEVIIKLQQAIEPENYFNPFRSITSSKPYCGAIHGRNFNINPQSFFFPSLTPSISGSVNSIEDKTFIDIELNSGTAALSGFVLMSILFFSVYSVCHSIVINFDPFYLLLLSLSILIIIFTNSIYLLNINRCTNNLAKLFEAKTIMQ